MIRETLLIGTLIIMGCAAQAQPVSLAQDGQSEHVIFHAADAPATVRGAALELQHYILAVSGARLEIVTAPQEPMISLGDNAAARAAGLGVEDIPLEGFRIVTRERNLFILGPDTGDDERTPLGGTSAGTRNGVYAFIEQFLGVRWLMPGEHGDFIPDTPTVTVPETDFSDAPFFLNRRLPYTQERTAAVQTWQRRMRLGVNLALYHGHNWARPTPASLFDEHPDWFPMRGGVRVPPTGWYKLCLTNDGLIRHFAEQAIRHFDENPRATCFSLSPSDGGGWCECPDCEAMYETDPRGRRSVTPAVLHFYNGVARIVAERHPDKVLAGYVYAAYVFPPAAGAEVEPNVFLVWAPHPISYGYPLFREENRQWWEQLFEQWSAVTDNIAYYDLCNWLSNSAGAPLPPGLKILEFVYPRLKQANMKGVYVYGQAAWGYGGVNNYLLAKLAWDPDADIRALFDEYLEKAYGAAAPEMKEFYELLDAEMERHFVQNEAAGWVLTAEIMRDVYAPNFPRLEALYRTAEAKLQDDVPAAARLAGMGENLTILHWNLRQFAMLDDPQASSFYISDADFLARVPDYRDSLAVSPIRIGGDVPEEFPPLRVAAAGEIPGAEATQVFRLRGRQHLVLQPTGQEDVQVRFGQIRNFGQLLSWSAHGADGREIERGLMSTLTPITLDPVGSQYYHLLLDAGRAIYTLEATGAAWAVSDRGGKGLHKLQHMTPLYFEVPPGTEAFHLQIEAEPPGETALATLYSPDGEETAHFDVTAVSVDRKRVEVGEGRHGWWKLVIRDSGVGVTDDVWIRGSEELTGWFSPVPRQALSVRGGN